MSASSLVSNIKSRDRGRPREFDVNAALDKAILYFRLNGYNGVSIADLSKALGLSAGSIYKAFHSKHELFTRALDRYMLLRGQEMSAIINRDETGREKLFKILMFYAHSSYATEGRNGCLVIVGAVELSNVDKEISRTVSLAMQQNEQRLKEVLLQGQNDKSISRDIDATSTAKTLLAIVQGMRILGKLDQSKESAFSVVRTAMKLIE